MSRKNFEYRRYANLAHDISAALQGREAVLDGEIVCIDANGAPQFYDLLYSRAAPCFTKPRIALLIVISTAVGYCYGIGSTFNFITFLHALVGTTLLAAGAATLNQWWERTSDARMNRTKTRPIPAGRVRARDAFWFGVALTVVGVGELWIFCNILATGLGLLTSVGYVCAYTPLKRKHAVCTTVGALPGAMPPLIGFAAASSHLGIDAWVLFSILFLWQFPHFHAIAWMYREDYERVSQRNPADFAWSRSGSRKMVFGSARRFFLGCGLRMDSRSSQPRIDHAQTQLTGCA